MTTAALAHHSPRRIGRLDLSADFGASDHGCWGYSSDQERAAAAAAWLADGLRLGQRAVYVCDQTNAVAVRELATVRDRDGALQRGALVVQHSAELYDLSAPIDAGAQLELYAGAVERAIDEGFRGVRVAADITPLVADPGRRAAHVHWEQVADRYMTEHPLAPICLYDTRKVRDLDAIVSVHPLQGPSPTPFTVHAIGTQRAAIAGELDALVDRPLAELLAQLPATDLVLDVSGLTFIDGHAAQLLHDELARRRARGQDVRLLSVPPLLRRIWTVFKFDPTFLAG